MIREELSDRYPDLLVMEPRYDVAIVGVVNRIGTTAICYDESKVIEILMNEDGMEYEEAREYYDFNILGAWVGETTPFFLETE